MSAAVCSWNSILKAVNQAVRIGSVRGSIMFIGIIATAQPAAPQQFTGSVQVPLNPLVDANGNPATDQATPLYSSLQNPREAVLAPDGHHITLAEWLEVGGVGQITRTPQGTQLRLELTGLVPNGVYTTWSFLFTDRPFNFAPIINTPQSVGMGAVGAIDGSESILRADAKGAATYVATIRPGPLSIKGEAPSWILNGFSSYAVVGVYNIDGQTYGRVPGPHHVGHFVVGFIPEPSAIVLVLVGACSLVVVCRRRGES
jgi:hypothetical protein